MECYDIHKTIICGGKKILKAQQMSTGRFVSIKVIETREVPEEISIDSLNEAFILQEISHPNIVHLVEVKIRCPRIYLVFEYFDLDLHTLIETSFQDDRIGPSLIKPYLYQITCGMHYCHTQNIIHRNMQSKSLLIYANGVIKITDFGMSIIIDVEPLVSSRQIGSSSYKAPELLLGATTYCYEIDIWSIGCIFAEMVIIKTLFLGDCETDVLFKIFQMLRTPTEEIWPGVTQLPYFRGVFPQWTALNFVSEIRSMNENGLSLLLAMLNYIPNQRITARDILRHPYFNDLDRSLVPEQPEDLV